MNDNVDVQSQSQADIFNLPNLLPNVCYRGHRRSRSGVDVKIQSDLTSDINSQQVIIIISCLSNNRIYLSF